MERGTEAQSKVTDVFSGDKKFYALADIEPTVDKIIEIHKRFERRYPELTEEIKVKADELDELIESLGKDFDFWEKNTTYGEMTDSPAYHHVRKATTNATEALESMKKFQKGELALLDDLSAFFNTFEEALNTIASVVARQDNRIKYLEEERKIFLSLKEKVPIR